MLSEQTMLASFLNPAACATLAETVNEAIRGLQPQLSLVNNPQFLSTKKGRYLRNFSKASALFVWGWFVRYKDTINHYRKGKKMC